MNDYQAKKFKYLYKKITFSKKINNLRNFHVNLTLKKDPNL